MNQLSDTNDQNEYIINIPNNFKLKIDEVDLVIYHGNCSDGFASALAVYIYFKPTNGMNINNKIVEYYPGVFKQSPPNVKNKNVLICDFSYDKKIMEKMIKDSNSLLVIDHHITARKALRSIPSENKYFDMKHSGASLTWSFVFPNKPLPLFIRYVEDNDIWLKKMKNTDAFCNYYYGLPQEFSEYEKFLDEQEIEKIMPIAIARHEQNEIYIKQAMSQTTMKFYKIDNEYFMIASCNTSILKSEIGNKLLSKYPYCDLAGVYSIRDNVTYYSLRSENTKLDTTKISSKFGGGGHRNASGMTSENSVEIGGKVIDTDITYKFLEGNFITIRENELFIRCMSNFNIHALGKYLLQISHNELIPGVTIDESDDRDDDELSLEEYNQRYRQVQKCCSIMRTKLNNQLYYTNCKASIVTTVMNYYNCTYTLFWNDTNVTNIVKNIFEDCKDFYLDTQQKKAWFNCSISDPTTEIKLSMFNLELKN